MKVERALAAKARALRLKARLLHAAISDLELRLGSAVVVSCVPVVFSRFSCN